MDNLTHTLIGVIAGEGIAQTRFARERRTACIAMAAIGSNLPDLDLLYTYGHSAGGKLDYLLGHRGYTHTIVGCVALAAVLYGLAWLWMRRHTKLTPRDHVILAGSALLGTMLHLLMDALNSYGVHPFWPVQNRWLYGDSVFIVEPLYWAAAAPLLFILRSLVARALIALVLVAAIGLSVFTGMVPVAFCLVLAGLIAVLLAVGARSTPRTAALASVAVTVSITVMFIVSGSIAARRVETIATAVFPGERVIDHVLTPMPANPLCWDVLLLQQHGDRYAARHAMLSIAPAVMRSSQCPVRADEARTDQSDASLHQTAPLSAVVATDTAAIRWLGEFAMPVSRLRRIVASDCVAASVMQFVRAPFIAKVGDAEWIGDLRYDREPRAGFSELKLGTGGAAAAGCAKAAPWIAPRADLLREPAG